ncbi:hypothetical protein STEG23_034839 [Scotinomys teguina]
MVANVLRACQKWPDTGTCQPKSPDDRAERSPEDPNPTNGDSSDYPRSVRWITALQSVSTTTYTRPKENGDGTQEHPDAVTPQGPKSTRTPSHHKDPGTPDTIRLGGPRCNQTILDQENPEVPQTSLDQEIPEAPIIL